jgi:hypothetical protein
LAGVRADGLRVLVKDAGELGKRKREKDNLATLRKLY